MVKTKWAWIASGVLVLVLLGAMTATAAVGPSDDSPGTAKPVSIIGGQYRQAPPWSVLVGPGYDEARPLSTCIVLAQGSSESLGGGGMCAEKWVVPDKAPLSFVAALETRARPDGLSVDPSGLLQVVTISAPGRTVLVKSGAAKPVMTSELSNSQETTVLVDGTELTISIGTVQGTPSDDPKTKPLIEAEYE